jgi:hypothetical protein
MLVIATAWIFYRPFTSGILIVAAIACILLLKRLHSKRAKAPAPAT